MAIDKNSKAYQSLLNKGYTDEQIQQMHGAVASGQSAQSVVSNTPKNTSTITYNGQVSDSNSGLNSVSQSSLDRNYNNAKVGTGHVAPMPEQPKTQSVSQPTVSTDALAKAWNGMDYDMQQRRLKEIAGLKEALDKKGIVSKTAPTTTTTKSTAPKQTYTQPTTPQDRWDYQDNSQARMDEIAAHLRDYQKTMPELFDDMSAFYNFFIKDKGRSQDQIDFLWDYYNRAQKYGKYDNIPADQLGNSLANGKLPEDYLNYLKATDPDKYAEVMAYKQEGEDTIKYESYLSEASEMAGFEGFIKWNREIMLFKDSNKDAIDDALYIPPSETEQRDVDRINQINGRRMEIKNIMKNMLDDLVEQYPGVPQSTLMGIVQDRTKDMQREDDDLAVELAQLQGSVEYQQNERNAKMDAREKTLNELQKNYGMYYDYSPEGITERARAQYAATNITLDQADSGTETDKQMALQNVLDGYYDKYGSIIQRSEQQVINDVIAYAKQNGVGLAQALEENFVKPLREKPEFATLSSGRTITNGGTDKWSIETIKDANGKDLSVMINQATGEIRMMDGTSGGVGTAGNGVSYNVVSPTELVQNFSSFVDGYEIGDYGGQCGEFVNNGLKAMGVANSNMYGNSKESKLNTKNEDANTTAQTGWVAIYDPSKLSGNGAKYGHVGFVVQDNGDGTVAILDSNGTPNANGKYDETVGYHPRVSKSSLYGYFNPSKGNGTVGGTSGEGEGEGDLFYARVLGWIPIQLRNTNIEKQWYIDIAKEQREKGLNAFEAAMSIVGFHITNKSEKAQNLKNMILDTIKTQGSETLFDSSTLSSMAEFINSGKYEAALSTLENQLGNYMETKGKYSRDEMSAAAKALGNLESVRTSKAYLPGAANYVSRAIKGEGKSTASFTVRVNNVSKVLRGLGYSEKEVEDMMPALTNTKSTFNSKLDAIEEALLGQYNSIRQNRGMPNMTIDALIGKQSLSDLYRIWDLQSIRDASSGARNMNLNLRNASGPAGLNTSSEAMRII